MKRLEMDTTGLRLGLRSREFPLWGPCDLARHTHAAGPCHNLKLRGVFCVWFLGVEPVAFVSAAGENSLMSTTKFLFSQSRDFCDLFLSLSPAASAAWYLQSVC